MHIVIAPDAFKGTLSASQASCAIAQGWRRERPDDRVVELPLADGGEGTMAAIAIAVAGCQRFVVRNVTGPTGAAVDAEYLRLPDGAVVVEMASSSGLPLTTVLRPLGATSRGLGEVLCQAMASGATQIAIALGGSASTDGGIGALSALGLRALDAEGKELPDGGGALVDLARIDVAQLRPPPPGGVRVLTDVDSPLLGPRGAATAFGPQKGANGKDIRRLEDGLARLSEVAGGDPSAPGAGAAGGAAYGLAALWNASLQSGSAAVGEIVGLSDAVMGADLVITGEGKFDLTSLEGKVVGYVMSHARRGDTDVAVVAGIVDPSVRGQVPIAISLTDLAGSTTSAMEDPERWLQRAGRLLAHAAL